jgi:pilus assembly protein CpaE
MALGQTLKVVAIVRSGEAGAALNESCGDMNGTRVDVHVGRLKDVSPDVEIFQNLDVLLLEVDPRKDEELEAVKSIIEERFPKVPVVATAADATLQDVRQLMRLGVVDVVPQPVSESDLAAALDYAGHSKAVDDSDGEGRGRIISFLKSSGGVGATTIAVQTSFLLAQRFKGEAAQVCLLDFDVQHGTGAIYMDMDNRVGLADLVGSPERLDGSLLRSVMGRHESGVDVLAAPADLMPLDAVGLDFIDNCLRVATKEYRYVIVDLPAAFTDWSTRVLKASDTVALVTQLTVPSVRQARRLLDVLTMSGLEGLPTKLLVNRYEKGWGKSVRLKQAEKALGRPADFCIVNDYQTVSEAVNQGVPLSKIARRSKVEKSLRQFVDAVDKGLAGDEARSEPRLKIVVGR